MHRYRHSHSKHDFRDLPDCVDHGTSTEAVDHDTNDPPKQSNGAFSANFVSTSSRHFIPSSPTEQLELPRGIFTATTYEIPGYRTVRCMGTVVGMSTRSRGFGPTLGAGFKTIVGGDIGALTKLMYRTRNDAVVRLCAECRKLGANAVVGMRFDTGQIADGIAQACVYGTAMYIVMEDTGADEEPQNPTELKYH
ncbi:hypothetical protein Daus18300_010465 [Diaporthe australafricana]|uniref:Uncharacterized protein n=1 Tax=Diaporthe australafricana TaxID=127596 RepID=A0ABR3WAA0_9PEZI